MNRNANANEKLSKCVQIKVANVHHNAVTLLHNKLHGHCSAYNRYKSAFVFTRARE